jgi:Fe-S oxidoreductase
LCCGGGWTRECQEETEGLKAGSSSVHQFRSSFFAVLVVSWHSF